MYRPSESKSRRAARKPAARGVRSCVAKAVEALELRLFLSVSPATTGAANPIAIAQPILSAQPNDTGLTSAPAFAKTPAQLRGAYGLGPYGASNITFNGAQADGSGQTIAIIDAFDDPNAASDLHNFDLAMGLPDPPNFTKVNEFGSQTNLPAPASSGSWGEEESLDIEYSHAMAPKANIILVEADSESFDDLVAQGVNWARYQPGVSVVSMSFGGDEWGGQTSYDSYFTTPTGHQGVTFIASTGDSGAYDPGTSNVVVEYPAISPNVLAAGGTKLTMSGVAGDFTKISANGTTATITATNNFAAGNSVTISGLAILGSDGTTVTPVLDGTFTITSATSTSFKFASSEMIPNQKPLYSGVAALTNTPLSTVRLAEAGWGNGSLSGVDNGGGGGVSAGIETAPSYQVGVVSSGLSGGFRTIPDVSAEADPGAPGVALYDSFDFGAATPWLAGYEGGTSLSAPLWAGLIAVANQGRAASNLPTFDGPGELLPSLYKLHASSTDFHDITTGNNGYAASAGYDLVTGIGTPIANNLIPDLISTDTAPVITSFGATPNPLNSQNANVTLSVAAISSSWRYSR